MTWALTWTSAPPGLDFDTETGALSGVPTECGIFDGTLEHVEKALTSSIRLFIFRPGKHFLAEVVDGALPDGVSIIQCDMTEFDGTDPKLDGTPNESGTFDFTIRFYDMSAKTADFVGQMVVWDHEE